MDQFVGRCIFRILEGILGDKIKKRVNGTARFIVVAPSVVKGHDKPLDRTYLGDDGCFHLPGYSSHQQLNGSLLDGSFCSRVEGKMEKYVRSLREMEMWLCRPG